MEVFGIIGFVFAMSALATAVTNQAQVKKLKDELIGVKKEIKELQSG